MKKSAKSAIVAVIALLSVLGMVGHGAQAWSGLFPWFPPPSTGRLVVDFETPNNVPGMVKISGSNIFGDSVSYVASKPATGTSHQIEFEVPPGVYTFDVKETTSGDLRYVADALPRVARVFPGLPTAVQIDYKLSQGVQRVRATSITDTSVGVTWDAPSHQFPIAVRRFEGDGANQPFHAGVRIPVSGNGFQSAGLKPGTQYTYQIRTMPRSNGLLWMQRREPEIITLTVGTTNGAVPGTATYVKRPETLLAKAADVAAVQPTGDGVMVTLADHVATPAPGAVVVLPASQVLRGGYLGKVVTVSNDGRVVKLLAAGIADGFTFYHVNVADLSAFPVTKINEETGEVTVEPAKPGTKIPASALNSAQPNSVPGAPTAKSATVPGADPALDRPVPGGTAVGSAPSSKSAAPQTMQKAAETECKKFSGTSKFEFNPSMTPAGHFNMTYDHYNILGVEVTSGARFDVEAAVVMTGGFDVKAQATYSCQLKLPTVMTTFPAGPVPMAFYFKPTARVSLDGSVEFSNVGAAVTAGFGVKGYVGLNDSVSLSGKIIKEFQWLTPHAEAVNGGLSAKVGGDVVIGPGAGTKDAGVIIGIGGVVNPLAVDVRVKVVPGPQACLEAKAGGDAAVVLTARAWLGWAKFEATYEVPGLNTEWKYGSLLWPNPCGAPNPTGDVVGGGVVVDDSSTTGNENQWKHSDGFIPGTKAWILSTGSAGSAEGPPSFFASTNMGGAGNDTLSAFSGNPTYDAASYKVRLIPAGSTLHVKYVFASEEYPEYVGSKFNDVMGVFVNGVNCATIPGTQTPVAINTVNHQSNAQYYVDNAGGASGYNAVYDGLTVPMECKVPVTPGVPVEVEIAVADASDGVYDSAIALVDKGIWAD